MLSAGRRRKDSRRETFLRENPEKAS